MGTENTKTPFSNQKPIFDKTYGISCVVNGKKYKYNARVGFTIENYEGDKPIAMSGEDFQIFMNAIEEYKNVGEISEHANLIESMPDLFQKQFERNQRNGIATNRTKKGTETTQSELKIILNDEREDIQEAFVEAGIRQDDYIQQFQPEVPKAEEQEKPKENFAEDEFDKALAEVLQDIKSVIEATSTGVLTARTQKMYSDYEKYSIETREVDGELQTVVRNKETGEVMDSKNPDYETVLFNAKWADNFIRTVKDGVDVTDELSAEEKKQKLQYSEGLLLAVEHAAKSCPDEELTPEYIKHATEDIFSAFDDGSPLAKGAMESFNEMFDKEPETLNFFVTQSTGKVIKTCKETKDIGKDETGLAEEITENGEEKIKAALDETQPAQEVTNGKGKMLDDYKKYRAKPVYNTYTGELDRYELIDRETQQPLSPDDPNYETAKFNTLWANFSNQTAKENGGIYSLNEDALLDRLESSKEYFDEFRKTMLSCGDEVGQHLTGEKIQDLIDSVAARHPDEPNHGEHGRALKDMFESPDAFKSFYTRACGDVYKLRSVSDFTGFERDENGVISGVSSDFRFTPDLINQKSDITNEKGINEI